MSDSENKKVQDVLREVAEIGEDGSIDDSWEHTLATLRDAVEVKPTPTWSGDLAACFREIANRIDRQSVVEVTAPAPTKDPFDEVAKLYPIDACEVKFVLDHYIASGCTHVPTMPKIGPKPEPTELECLAAPSIYLTDCIIHVYGGADDQSVQPLD